MQWISIEERLPRPGELVLAWCTLGVVFGYGFAKWIPEHNVFVDEVGAAVRVTHWTMLPAPPPQE